MENLLENLFKAIFIIPTFNQRKQVQKIIQFNRKMDCSNAYISNEICEFLQISKRENRAAITNVLENNNN
jgi:hypothetical protein